MGADSINKDIRAHGILERYVEGLKIEHGCAVPENVDATKQIKVPGRTSRDPKLISFQNLASIIEARLKDIADFIKAEIKTAGYEGKLGAGIVITGGSANLKDIDLMLEKYLGMEVRIAAPTVLVDDESVEIASNTAYSTVVGLMLEAMKESNPACLCQHAVRRDRPVEGFKNPNSDSNSGAHSDAETEKRAKQSEDRPSDTHGNGFFAKIKDNITKYFDYDDQIIDDDN